MFGLGIQEITLIVLVIALLFGGAKITGLARSLGRFGGEFKKGRMEIEKEIELVRDSVVVETKGKRG